MYQRIARFTYVNNKNQVNDLVVKFFDVGLPKFYVLCTIVMQIIYYGL